MKIGFQNTLVGSATGIPSQKVVSGPPSQPTWSMDRYVLDTDSMSFLVQAMPDALAQVRCEMRAEIPDLVPIAGHADPVDRLMVLFKGVARIAQGAAGHAFDTVINPCSGSDMSAGLCFGCSHLVTIDKYDLFEVRDRAPKKLEEYLREKLRGKLVNGMHQFNDHGGLVSYVMELYLCGVDFDSIKVESSELIEDMMMISLSFMIDDRKVTHTHFNRVELGTRFDPGKPAHDFLRDQLVGIIEQSEHLAVLNKAGGDGPWGPNVATSSLYPLLPEGTIVISDAGEAESLKASGSQLTTRSIVARRVKRRLNRLQGNPPPKPWAFNSWTDPRLSYGYAFNLTDLEILVVKKPGSFWDRLPILQKFFNPDVG